MEDRVMVVGTSCVVKLIAGGKDGIGTGLILRGEWQCYDLAAELVAAGDKIVENREGPIPPDPISNGGRGKQKNKP